MSIPTALVEASGLASARSPSSRRMWTYVSDRRNGVMGAICGGGGRRGGGGGGGGGGVGAGGAAVPAGAAAGAGAAVGLSAGTGGAVAACASSQNTGAVIIA